MSSDKWCVAKEYWSCCSTVIVDYWTSKYRISIYEYNKRKTQEFQYTILNRDFSSEMLTKVE